MKNIVLFGFMGTGKSSVGKKLADDLGMKFVEMDGIIEEREKTTISDIFAKKGEPYFRLLERNLVKELSGLKGLVVSTGGGVVLDQENIKDFEREGILICLTAVPEEIFKRVKPACLLKERTEKRPLLDVGDPLKKIKELLDYRRPYYDKIKIQIDTTGKDIKKIVCEIEGLIK